MEKKTLKKFGLLLGVILICLGLAENIISTSDGVFTGAIGLGFILAAFVIKSDKVDK